MSIFKRLLGLPTTPLSDDACWRVNDGVVEIARKRAPELDEPGGALRLEGEGLSPRLLVVHGIDDEFHAYANACACSGWRVDPVPGENQLKCATLGSSTYDYKGKPLSGPADKPLTAYPVEVTEHVIKIKITE